MGKITNDSLNHQQKRLCFKKAFFKSFFVPLKLFITSFFELMAAEYEVLRKS